MEHEASLLAVYSSTVCTPLHSNDCSQKLYKSIKWFILGAGGILVPSGRWDSVRGDGLVW